MSFFLDKRGLKSATDAQRQARCGSDINALKAFQDSAPLYVPIFLNTYAAIDRVAVALMDGKITWGQAAQDWQEETTK